MVWILSILVVGSIPVAVWAVRSYQKRKKAERLHEDFAREHGLKMAYLQPEDVQIYGHYRDYPAKITTETLPHSSTELRTVLKVVLPMINPNRKCLRISVDSLDYPEFDRLVVLDRPIKVQHDLGEWLRMESNDLFFSSLILTDDIKISLYEIFKDRPAVLLYIQDDELALISPTLLRDRPDAVYIDKQLNVLCDIKDELNLVFK